MPARMRDGAWYGFCSGANGRMKHRRRSHALAPILGALCALLWTFSPAASPAGDEQPFERIFASFNKPVPPAYRALRHMEAGLPGSDRHGRMDAWTEYQPSQGFRFEVVSEQGSDYIRKKVLRKLLVNEQELIASGKPLRPWLTSNNYEFSDAGVTANGLQKVTMIPARRGDGLIDGALFVAPGENSIVGLQGRLVKSPSFWVRDVDVTWQYARAGDHTVPTQFEATARVRFWGPAYLKMTYEYASIDGRSTTEVNRTGGREN